MGLMLKLNLSPLLWPMLINILRALLWGLLYAFKLKSQNWAYEFFYILKMY